MQDPQDTTIKQEHMSMGFLLAWLMLIWVVQWIMVDMYLPALPQITKEFDVSEAILNITITAGFVGCAIGTLIGGVLSDRYGRKGLFLIGLAGAAGGSFVSALSHGVPLLAGSRFVALFASGFVLSITMALIKDSYYGREFTKATSGTQAIAATGPIFAPAVGALLINWSSWRMIFIVLGILNLVALIPMLRLTETWPKEKRVVDSMLDTFKQMLAFGKDKAFITFLIVTSSIVIPMWAYVGVSAYIYIDEFGLSNTAYGFYYGGAAVMSVLAPVLYMQLSKYISPRKIGTLAFVIMIVASVLLLTTGSLLPVFFLIGSVTMLTTEGLMRPLTMVAALDEYPTAAGTVSSLLQFVVNMMAVLATTIATLKWVSFSQIIAIMTTVCMVIGIISWFILLKKKMMKSLE